MADSCTCVVVQWATKAEIHFNSAPVVLVGLKQDLRPGFPTLKLLHLNEPSATSIGQVRPSSILVLDSSWSPNS